MATKYWLCSGSKRRLLDLAAEVVVNNVEDKRDFQQLNIPLCLVDYLGDKLWDVWWGNVRVDRKNNCTTLIFKTFSNIQIAIDNISYFLIYLPIIFM